MSEPKITAQLSYAHQIGDESQRILDQLQRSFNNDMKVTDEGAGRVCRIQMTAAEYAQLNARLMFNRDLRLSQG